MKFLIPLVVFSAVSTLAVAEPMKLTVTQLQAIDAGLTALDGQQKIVKINGQDQVVPQPYTFTLKVREEIIRDKIAVEASISAQREIFKGFSMSVKGAKDEQDQLTAENFKIMDSVQDVNLTKLSFDDFDLADNPIPGSVISTLAPIVSDK